MATSSSYDHAVTASQIIKDSLLMVNGIGVDEDVDGSTTTDILRLLNHLIKQWHTSGYHRWNKKEFVVPLINGQEEYAVGVASGDDEWTLEDDFANTTLSADAASGAATYTITAKTAAATGGGIAASDRIGLELDDGTRQWTTISTLSTLTVTPAATPTSAAASGNTVFAYTSRGQRPIRIIHARRVPVTGTSLGSSTDMEQLSHEEYFSQPSKTTAGSPVSYYYKPTLTAGTLYVWQPPNDSNWLMKGTAEYPIEDFDATSDNPDFPQEFYLTAVLELAVLIEPQYGTLADSRLVSLERRAAVVKEETLMFDNDDDSMYIQPDRRGW